jgi:thiosulfate/3-mercaptopyruvate sulfurtransferase
MNEAAHSRASVLLLAGLIAASAGLSCRGCVRAEPSIEDPYRVEETGSDLFVSPDALMEARAGGAAILDTRGAVAYRLGHIPGAVHAPWDAFTQGMLSGLLKEDVGELESQLRALGVRDASAVVVYGDWDQGWGEEGRVFWMLEHLGHTEVRVLYGGMRRWSERGLPTQRFSGDPPVQGDFRAAPPSGRRILSASLRDKLGGQDLTILDVRSREEFDGATPYGSPRGGRIPGARHFFWREVFAADGNLLPAGQVRARLASLGFRGGSDTVVTYCTGGVRSGFVYLVLRWLGVSAPVNYDGSWWEWSDASELPVEADAMR